MQTAGIWCVTVKYSHFTGIYFILTKTSVNMNLLHKHAYYIIIGGDNTLNERADRIYREDTERIRFGRSSAQSLQRYEHKNMIFTISKIYIKCNII